MSEERLFYIIFGCILLRAEYDDVYVVTSSNFFAKRLAYVVGKLYLYIRVKNKGKILKVGIMETTKLEVWKEVIKSISKCLVVAGVVIAMSYAVACLVKYLVALIVIRIIAKIIGLVVMTLFCVLMTFLTYWAVREWVAK